jgi:hypothetical protein
MARELQNIMVSGELINLDLDGLDVKQAIEKLRAAVASGIKLPELPASEAGDNSLFFNTDNDRVCWKATGGLVFKLRMQLL